MNSRVSEQGKRLGQAMARIAERGRSVLAAHGLAAPGVDSVRDDMCASCACRPGTVPNGCTQTQLDLLKCIVEGKPFYCHAPRDGRMCAGWVAARAQHVASPLPLDAQLLAFAWEYSPPEEQS